MSDLSLLNDAREFLAKPVPPYDWVRETALMRALADYIEALETKNANQAQMIDGYRKDNLETKCEQIKILCEDHGGMSARMLARDILEILDRDDDANGVTP